MQKRKDEDWFKRVLKELLSGKNFLISSADYERNKSFAEGRYDVTKIKEQYMNFNTPANEIRINFTPIDILGSRRTSVISILEKQGFEVKARCTDPTAVAKKDQDIALLKAEKELEPVMRELGQALGMKKPLALTNEEDFFIRYLASKRAWA